MSLHRFISLLYCILFKMIVKGITYLLDYLFLILRYIKKICSNTNQAVGGVPHRCDRLIWGLGQGWWKGSDWIRGG